MKVYIMLFIFFGTQSLSSTIKKVDFCKLPCLIKNETVEHIMCTLKNDCSIGSECKVRTQFKLTEEIRSLIMDIHNFYRNKVALGQATGFNKVTLPEGADMLEMVWDEELAYFAQCYANKCILQYDKCRQNSLGENVGQLIFIRVFVNPKTIEEIITDMIGAVFRTSKDMTVKEIEEYKDNKHTKQFTQLAWARSERIGCGITKLLENLDAYFMVCNYGPAGNIENERVYEVGLPCSNCPKHRKCGERYTGLCATTQNEKNSLEIIPAFSQVLERASLSSSNLVIGNEYINTETNERTEENSTTYSRFFSAISSAADNKTNRWDKRLIAENISSAEMFLKSEDLNNEEPQITGSNGKMKDANISLEDTALNGSSASEGDVSAESRNIPITICKIRKKAGWAFYDEHDRGEASSAMNLFSIKSAYINLLGFVYIFLI